MSIEVFRALILIGYLAFVLVLSLSLRAFLARAGARRGLWVWLLVPVVNFGYSYIVAAGLARGPRERGNAPP